MNTGITDVIQTYIAGNFNESNIYAGDEVVSDSGAVLRKWRLL
jgi:hypothetical protein